MNDDQLRDAVADLLAVQRKGQLPDLLLAFATACREAGGLPAPAERKKWVKTLRPAADLAAHEVTTVAAHMFGVSEARCRQLTLDALNTDPWTRIALDVLAAYRPAPPPPAPPAKNRGCRKW